MITHGEAIKMMNELALSRRKTLKTESIKLLDSVGRIASQDVFSDEQIPSFNNSAMDGFAFKSQDTMLASSNHPIRFKVLGCIAAGDASFEKFEDAKSMTSYEIMTGAPMPSGYDSCAKIEDCEVLRNPKGQAVEVTIRSPLSANKNLREAGHDFQKGAQILRAGERIRAEHFLGLASVGTQEVQVFSKIRVALIATGKELVPFEKKPEKWQLRNSTQPYLQARLSEWTNQIDCFLLNDDKKDEFKRLVQNLVQQKFDLIVSTGAVSMGRHDFIAEALNEIGATTFFHKVAIRPGKPILFAEKDSTNIVSLPGNPVSSVIGYQFFIEAYLRQLFLTAPINSLQARCVSSYEKPLGFRCFLKAHLNYHSDSPSVEILEGQMSSMVSSLLKANSWVVAEESRTQIAVGDILQVYPFRGGEF